MHVRAYTVCVFVSIALMHVKRRRVTMTTVIDGGRRERG